MFEASTAPYITERRWHTTQHARPLPDGRLELSLDVSIDYALKSWILSFGRSLEVRAPEALVTWHREEAAAMLRTGGAADDLSTGVSLRADRLDPATRDQASPRAQRALPFSSGWYPALPFIVADAHGGGSSEADEAYLGTMLREAESARPPTRGPVKTSATTRGPGKKR